QEQIRNKDLSRSPFRTTEVAGLEPRRPVFGRPVDSGLRQKWVVFDLFEQDIALDRGARSYSNLRPRSDVVPEIMPCWRKPSAMVGEREKVVVGEICGARRGMLVHAQRYAASVLQLNFEAPGRIVLAHADFVGAPSLYQTALVRHGRASGLDRRGDEQTS